MTILTLERVRKMSSDSSSKLDIAPLTIIVSEGLDPRVRRQMEAEQQADVKTYTEMTRDMEVQHDLNKIKQEVSNDKNESDPFKEPESVEEKVENTPAPAPAADTSTPAATPAPTPAVAGSTETPAAQPAPSETAPAATGTEPAPAPAAAATPAPAAGGDAEDLESAFESHGMQLPKDLLRRVAKDYIKMESGDHDIGSLEHIKTFVYVDLGQNNVKGDTLESVQTIKDPENTIVLIIEESSPNADTTLRARKVAEMLTSRGVKVFYAMDEVIDYLNNLYDTVSGRTKGSE